MSSAEAIVDRDREGGARRTTRAGPTSAFLPDSSPAPNLLRKQSRARACHGGPADVGYGRRFPRVPRLEHAPPRRRPRPVHPVGVSHQKEPLLRSPGELRRPLRRTHRRRHRAPHHAVGRGAQLPLVPAGALLLLPAAAHHLRGRLHAPAQKLLPQPRDDHGVRRHRHADLDVRRGLPRLRLRKGGPHRGRRDEPDGGFALWVSNIGGRPCCHFVHHGLARVELRPSALLARLWRICAQRRRGHCSLQDVLQVLRRRAGLGPVQNPRRARRIRRRQRRQRLHRRRHRPHLLVHLPAHEDPRLPKVRNILALPLCLRRLRFGGSHRAERHHGAILLRDYSGALQLLQSLEDVAGHRRGDLRFAGLRCRVLCLHVHGHGLLHGPLQVVGPQVHRAGDCVLRAGAHVEHVPAELFKQHGAKDADPVPHAARHLVRRSARRHCVRPVAEHAGAAQRRLRDDDAIGSYFHDRRLRRPHGAHAAPHGHEEVGARGATPRRRRRRGAVEPAVVRAAGFEGFRRRRNARARRGSPGGAHARREFDARHPRRLA